MFRGLGLGHFRAVVRGSIRIESVKCSSWLRDEG